MPVCALDGILGKLLCLEHKYDVMHDRGVLLACDESAFGDGLLGAGSGTHAESLIVLILDRAGSA
eukprot:359267-Chlamydomonas_euryale.AAC.2